MSTVYRARLFVFLSLASIAFECTAQDVKFLMPLKGQQGKDYWIGYYVDRDFTEGIKDGRCGSKTYDGHKGTDFMLRSFKTMDSGVYVYAVADGVVFATDDGYFDRNKKWGDGKEVNYIGILHGQSIRTYYYHLMKNSLMVKVGEEVKAGQPIAKVGSSGYSAYPHLHLEVRDEVYNVVDPFSSVCPEVSKGLWIDEPRYDTSIFAIDQGFVPYVPKLDTLLERHLVTDEFNLKKDIIVCYWVQMHGLQKGQQWKVEWYDPEGNLWQTDSGTWEANWWYDYTWSWISLPDEKGRWLAKYYVNNRLITEKNFYITKKKRRHI